ncbi:MAG: hypothetical protein V2I48_06220 [Xanthomonadales bacterium]|jgi:hypothetical protein|nr:hypothetical protein [Xanthomonadales bacterium]
MKKVLIWVVRIAVLLLLLKIVLWSWEQYQRGGRSSPASEVPELDKQCQITNPDTGACVCIDRKTRERLPLSYNECVQRARGK